MAPKLHPGERVLYAGHPSWRSTLDFYVKGLLAVALVALVVAVISGLGEGGPAEGLVTLVAVIGVALVLLAGFLRRVATSYTITNRRLHIKRGIVSRTIQETRLARVQNVNYHQGVLQRVLQIGDVDFDTAAGEDYNFVFTGVSEPDEVVRMVDRATGASPASPSAPSSEPEGQPPRRGMST